MKSENSVFNKEVRTPKVSLAVISYNQEGFIDEALESAINQDYENLEIVVSDDGSSDETAKKIVSWQARFPERLTVLPNTQNVGVTPNGNRALKACSGEYIAILCGDDVLLPGKITSQVEWFEQDTSRVLCGHAVEIVMEDGSRAPEQPPTKLREGVGPNDYILKGSLFFGPSIMVRTSAMPKHGFDEAMRIAPDLLFYIEVLSGGGRYGYVDGVYAKYRHHPDGVSTRYREMRDDREKTYRIIADRYPEYREICKEALIRNVDYAWGCRLLDMKDKKAARKEFVKVIKKKPQYLKAWIRLLQAL